MIIDAHAHVLPGADHGCDSSQMADKQLDMATDAGVELLVATPHYYPNRENPDTFLSRREKCFERLLKLNRTAPELRLGGEIFICEGLEHLESLEALCVSSTRTILIEMPTARWSTALMDTLRSIRDERGLTPLIVHIDRYLPENSLALLNEGFFCQINCSAIKGVLSRRRCMKYIDTGGVYALGSDIHGLNDGYASFITAKKILGSRFSEIMEKSEALL